MTEDQGSREGGDVRMEVTLPAPFDVVWRWVRDPDLIRRWHGWEDPGLDDEIKFMYVDKAQPDEDERSLRIGNHLFAFESRGDSTVVRLTRAAPAVGQEWTDEYYGMVEQGWTIFVEQLRLALARHADAERRTVFLYGKRPDATTTAAALGLSPAGALAPGSRYSATLPTGDDVAGEVWFVTDHELGVTVDGWGDGLLVVATGHGGAGGDTGPGAPSMVVITTYGMTDAAVDDLHDRWTAWWSANHAAADLTSS